MVGRSEFLKKCSETVLQFLLSTTALLKCIRMSGQDYSISYREVDITSFDFAILSSGIAYNQSADHG